MYARRCRVRGFDNVNAFDQLHRMNNNNNHKQHMHLEVSLHLPRMRSLSEVIVAIQSVVGDVLLLLLHNIPAVHFGCKLLLMMKKLAFVLLLLLALYWQVIDCLLRCCTCC